MFPRNECHHHVRGAQRSLPDVPLALVPGYDEHTLHTTDRVHMGNCPLDPCGSLAAPCQILSVAVVMRDIKMAYQLSWNTNTNMAHCETFGLLKPILEYIKCVFFLDTLYDKH